MPIDGGIAALSGYLYQTIGALGIAGRLFNQTEIPNADNSNLDLFLHLLNINQTDEVRIYTERYGEDALLDNIGISPNDDNVLVQFKFSRNPNENPIGRGDLQEIIDNFDQNVQRAAADGSNVSACILISNRRFTSGRRNTSSALWDEIRSQKEFRLENILEVPQEYLEGQLRDFANSYGVYPDEYEDGLNKLIGEVIRDATDREYVLDSGIVKEKIIRSFTGFGGSNSLRINDLQQICRKGLEFVEKILIINREDKLPIKRELQDSIFKLMQERTLIGLYGPGGCGKSVLLWQIANNSSEDSAYAIFPIDRIFDNFIPLIINSTWRNLPGGAIPHDTIDRAIGRILISNPGIEHPIFILGIDGIDEAATPFQYRQHVGEVINWFWNKDREIRNTENKPDAVLIVTCRREDHLRNILGIPKDSHELMPPMVQINAFSDREVLSAFQEYFPDYVTPSLDSSIMFRGPESLPSKLNSYEASQLRINDESLLSSLKHPVVWRPLLNLDESTRELALQGDIEARNQLADGMINWFDYKLGLRHSYLELRGEELSGLLSRIAGLTDSQSLHSAEQWIDTSTPLLGQLLARRFFVEADLAGLIEIVSPTQWRWKHRFVFEYLTTHDG